MGPAGVTHPEPRHLVEGLTSVFVASGFKRFIASRSVAVESYLTRLLKDVRKSEKGERKWEQSICLQEFGVITPTHVST